MKTILENGGAIIYILLFASTISLAVVIEKFFYYIKNEKNLKKRLVLEENSELVCSKNKNSIEKLINLLVKEKDKQNKVDYVHLEEIAREYTLETTLKLENKLWLLAVISNLSPLLGLFGTVTGMITAFEVIAIAGTGDPKLLAAGISKALITTAGGLAVAMPTTVFLNYFSKKNDELITIMEKATVEFLNVLRGAENG